MNPIQPTIGIISDIGPLAGADVLTKLFAYAADAYGAHEDSEYPDVILLNHGIAGVDNTANLDENFKTELVKMVKQLETYGATIIGIACNTAHHYLNDMKLENQTTEIINLIDSVAQEARKSIANEPFGLLTSNGTRNSHLYHEYLQNYSVNFIETNDKQQALIDESIDCVMAHKNRLANTKLMTVINEMQKQHNLRQFIAGCTELPIALDDNVSDDIMILSSSYILAKRLADRYYRLLGVKLV